jgi:hypothetical protein
MDKAVAISLVCNPTAVIRTFICFNTINKQERCMITFTVCLIVLVLGYAFYGLLTEKVFGIAYGLSVWLGCGTAAAALAGFLFAAGRSAR